MCPQAANMEDLSSGLFTRFMKDTKGADIGKYLKEEIEEAISPVSSRVDRLEKKIDLLILAVERVEKLLNALSPLTRALSRLPFIK